MSIELRQGVPPLTEAEAIRQDQCSGLELADIEWVLDRYAQPPSRHVDFLLWLDAICQQAARAQVAEAELAQLKTINDFGRVPPSCSPAEQDAGIDALAAGGHVWDGKSAGQWQRELRGDRPWHEQPTLRDQFAMHAPVWAIHLILSGLVSPCIEAYARAAYEWADAMIAASGRGVQARDTRGDLV